MKIKGKVEVEIEVNDKNMFRCGACDFAEKPDSEWCEEDTDCALFHQPRELKRHKHLRCAACREAFK